MYCKIQWDIKREYLTFSSVRNFGYFLITTMRFQVGVAIAAEIICEVYGHHSVGEVEHGWQDAVDVVQGLVEVPQVVGVIVKLYAVGDIVITILKRSLIMYYVYFELERKKYRRTDTISLKLMTTYPGRGLVG